MALDAATVEQYARQIVITDIGIVGQERLCASKVWVLGGDAVAENAARYLSAAGSTVLRTEPPVATPPSVILAPLSGQSPNLYVQGFEAIPIVWWSLCASPAQITTGCAKDALAFQERAQEHAQASSDACPQWLCDVAGADAASLACAASLAWEPMPSPRSWRVS